MAKQYIKKFRDPLFKEACKVCTGCGRMCECAEKDLAKTCKKMNEAIKKLDEKCPEGSKPRNGQCALADNSGYRRGVCDTGWIFDPTLGSNGKCIKHTDK